MSELSKQALKVDNNQSFPNNNSGLITPSILRAFNENMIDSMVDEIGYNQDSASWNQQIDALESTTGSLVGSSSLALYTASFNNGTRNLTFTKGDTTQFSVNIPDVSGSGGNFVTTSSFNAYTSSNDQRVSSLEVNSASVNISVSNINAFTASQQTINTNVSASQSIDTTKFNTIGTQSGSWFNVPLDSLNSFTASQNTKNTTLATYTASVDTKFSTLGTQSGSWITESETASFARTNVDNNFSVNQTFTNITAVSASFTYVQTTYETSSIIYSSGSNQFGDELSDIQTLSGSVRVQGSLTVNGTPVQTSSVDITSLNAFTASQETKNSTLATYTASVDSSLTNINTFTASNGNTSLNAYTQSNDTKWSNLAGQTGSYVTSAITASSLVTASVNLNTITFTKGDASTFNITVDTGSGGGGADLTSLNAFTASQETKDLTLASVTSSLNSATASLFTSASLALVTASFSGNTLTFTKGDTSTFGVVIPDVSGSAGTTIYEVVYTGESITKGDPLYISGSQGANPIVYKADASNPDKMPVTFVSNETIGAANTTEAIVLGLIEGIDLTGYVAGQSIYVAEGGGWSANLPSGSNSVTQLLGVVTKGGSGGKGLVLNPGPAQLPGLDTGYLWVGGSTNQPVQVTSASFATTGSNVFTGDQTLVDAAGNSVTLTDTSGSLMLVAKSYTSASAHLSSSANLVNLIFKYNNNTADTIISGSGNIFPNPSAPTAGFKRYVGGNNNIYNALAIPQISGSMAFPVSMNANMGSMAVTMRGPVSSSAWGINTNFVIGSGIFIGSSATQHAQGLISGLTMTQNIIAGTLSVNANQSNLTTAPTISQNNINGTAALNLSSSTATFSSNTINDSGFVLTNQYYTSSAGTGAITVSRNTIGGASNTILTTGIADAGAAQPNIVNNLIGGASNILFTNSTGAGNAQSVASTIVYGNTLIVTGSSVTATTATYGSAFFGRFNDINGTKDLSAETIFAVGTGTSTSARKTGFLIDSGSNTFIEGTLNVSGSTTMTGSLILSSSNAVELQVIGNTQFTGSVNGNVVSMSIASNTASMDFNLGNYFELSASVSPLRIELTNVTGGTTKTLALNGVTSSAITWTSNVLQPSGSAYTASVSGSNDILSFVAFNSNAVNVVSTLKMI